MTVPVPEDEPDQCTWQQEGHRCVRDKGHRWAHMDAGAADTLNAYRADKVGRLRRERVELRAQRRAAGYVDQSEVEVSS